MKQPEQNKHNQQRCSKCDRIVGCDYRGRKHKCGCVVIEQQKQDCEYNGFYNTPAECEDYECAHCPLYYDKMGKKQIGCPYVDN